MAKYDITYACGHTTTIELLGKMSDRERKIKYYESQDCPDCKKAARKKEYNEAIQKAKEMQLPDLEGTEDQIGWANVIRLTAFEILEDIKSYIALKEPLMLSTVEKYKNYLEDRKRAIFWINNRVKFESENSIYNDLREIDKQQNQNKQNPNI